MEEIQQKLVEAKECLRRADHMASVTFSLLNETKLLLVIVDNLYQAIGKSIEALLRYDYLYKRIGEIPLGERARLQFFKDNVARRYNIPYESMTAIKELYDLMEKRKKSPMEFVRKDTYIIASNEYKLRLLDIKKVKEYVEKTKMFIKKVESVIEIRDRRSNHF
ncbi:MAG: hypothetical protein AABW64_01045 [Nanoarchaeota archaeon]